MVTATLLLALLPQAGGEAEWRERVLPMMRAYRFDCHGDGSKKGGFALDA